VRYVNSTVKSMCSISATSDDIARHRTTSSDVVRSVNTALKRDYLVHIICSKCPTSAETHAFRRLRKSFIALLIVVYGKSSQICCFYNVNKHVGYDMTSTVTSIAQEENLEVKF